MLATKSLLDRYEIRVGSLRNFATSMEYCLWVMDATKVSFWKTIFLD